MEILTWLWLIAHIIRCIIVKIEQTINDPVSKYFQRKIDYIFLPIILAYVLLRRFFWVPITYVK